MSCSSINSIAPVCACTSRRLARICLCASLAIVAVACNDSTVSTPSTSKSATAGTGPAIEHTVSPDKRIHVWIKDKPDNVSLFDSDPGEIEPELLHGRWLMIVYSMLSGPDAQVAVSAGDIARELDGTVRIGIRPTRAFTESKTWIPTFDDIEHLDEMARIDSPLWLIIDGGKVTSWHCGRMNVEQAVTFAKK